MLSLIADFFANRGLILTSLAANNHLKMGKHKQPAINGCRLKEPGISMLVSSFLLVALVNFINTKVFYSWSLRTWFSTVISKVGQEQSQPLRPKKVDKVLLTEL